MKNPIRTRRRRRPLARAATAALTGGVLIAGGVAAGGASAAPGDAPAGCIDPALPLTVEETRLTAVLPDAADPSVPASRTFARTMIEGAGFGDYTAALTERLCATEDLDAATELVTQEGTALWRAAVARAQSTGPVAGDLPASDDRPLYWTRVESMAVMHQWAPGFELDDTQRQTLVDTFDRAARGMFDIDLPEGPDSKRVIVSGFDPYTLDGGVEGSAPGTVGNNIRHGNPSGATALSIDGTTYLTADGRTAYMEAYTLPVSYPEFERGYLEDTVGPFMQPGPRQLDASITVSQAGGLGQFNIEQYNARYHGVSPGNDRLAPCAPVDGVAQLALDNPGCNTRVVDRWKGSDAQNEPPQWTEATLPFAEMYAARAGADIPRPPGADWPDQSVAFGTVWHTNYTQFPDCASPELETFNSPPPTVFPPPTAPVPPAEGSCSYSGGGGNYLSNESAYRNTLLRDRFGLDIPAGHIHTPEMQQFESDFSVSDPTFDAWRTAISAQVREYVHIVMDTVEADAPPAASSTSLSLSRSTLLLGGRSTASVRVTADDDRPVTGSLEIRVNNRVRETFPVTADADGRVSYTLPRLPRGVYLVTARFVPDTDDVTDSTSTRKPLLVWR